MKASKDKFPFLGLHSPWRNNPNNIWLASTVSISRNIGRYSFPSHLEPAEREQLISLLAGKIGTHLDQPYVLNANELGPLEKEFIYEHFLYPHPFQQAAAGEGFIVDKQGTLLALLNIQDHLRLHLTDCREELEKAWSQLVKIESAVGKSLNYAYSNRFGFLTANPARCGTALLVRTYLHLPALIQAGQLNEMIAHEEVEAASIRGSMEDMAGDIVVISNRCTVGLTEEQIIQTVRTVSTKLVVAEKALRATMRDKDDIEAKDHVSRAFGLLRHSYQLEMVEAWSAISQLKLGTDLGWVKGTNHTALNDLLITCRRAHLVSEYSDDVHQGDLPHRRAEYVHASLASTDLVI